MYLFTFYAINKNSTLSMWLFTNIKNKNNALLDTRICLLSDMEKELNLTRNMCLLSDMEKELNLTRNMFLLIDRKNKTNMENKKCPFRYLYNEFIIKVSKLLNFVKM